jgi:threonyl-tRNA synthetase
VENTGELDPAIELRSLAGAAYWRNDEKKPSFNGFTAPLGKRLSN